MTDFGNAFSREDQTVVLRDGRVLGFAEYGATEGEPVFYFHGWPGSRLEARSLSRFALDAGARIFAPDRPGYARSDHLRGRALAQWPEDVRELANARGVDHFAVIGMSGGGPYALACAAGLRDHVTRVSVIGGLGPLNTPLAAAGMRRARRIACAVLRRTPSMSLPLLYFASRTLRRNAGRALDDLAGIVCEADRLVLSDPAIRAMLAASFAEAVRAGLRGPARDLRLYFLPWGFDLRDISAEVTFWHGELDVIISADMSRCLAPLLPRAHLAIVPGEGHYSLPIRHVESILRSLMGAV